MLILHAKITPAWERIGIIFDTRVPKYELDLQWISFGLDLYGDKLVENYVYRFNDLKSLLAYLSAKYQINITDIPRKIPVDQFPNPIYDAPRTPEFEAAWQRFQEDFKRRIFLDLTQKLVYSTGG